MRNWLMNHLSDEAALAELRAHDLTCRRHEALLIAHLALVDERKLYAGQGYECMRDWCMHELGYSEDAAHKRIRVGRAARSYPPMFDALADGLLHVTGALMLAPWLDRSNPAELVEAACGKSKLEIERMLAAKFPSRDLATMFTPPANSSSVALEPPVPSGAPAAAQSEVPVGASTRTRPLSQGRTGFTTTIDDETLALLEEFRALAAHAVDPSDMNAVLKRALSVAVVAEKKRKFGVGVKCRSKAERVSGREVPDVLKQHVYERDQGCCSFVGANGRRCGSRRRLEIDHVQPVADGGVTERSNLRLLCRTHNQHEAKRRFGEARIANAREQEARAKASADQAKQREAARLTALEQKVRDGVVLRALTTLGFSPDEARLGLALCAELPDGSDEACVKHALRELWRRRGGGKIEIDAKPAS